MCGRVIRWFKMAPPTQIESRPPAQTVDLRRHTRIITSPQMILGIVVGTASLVVAAVALLPQLLPKTATVATQGYVDGQVGEAKKASDAALATQQGELKQVRDQIKVIVVKVDDVLEQQQRARAAQEASRVVARVRNADEQLREYQRVYDAALANQRKGKEPLEGVALP